MRLTKDGRDYHLAILLAAAVGLLTGEVLFAALGLAMALTSVISLLLLRSRLPRAIRIRAKESQVRLFKGERGSITLRTPRLRGSWARVEVESVAFDGPVTTSVSAKGPDEVSVTFSPETAGRYTSAEAKVEVQDTVGLFAVPRSLTISGFVVDSLPLSLLARPTRVYVPPLVVGDSPAGTPGKGQEFYGIEEYTEQSESRDILWKRAARDPDRPLLARVREANSPEAVGLVVVAGAMTSQDRPKLLDLECEALGELGKALLLAGADVEVLGPDGTSRVALDDDSLADAIMEVSASKVAGVPERVWRSAPSVTVVVGVVEPETLGRLPRGASVYIGGGQRHIQDASMLDFTGVEPLTGIVTRVLGA